MELFSKNIVASDKNNLNKQPEGLKMRTFPSGYFTGTIFRIVFFFIVLIIFLEPHFKNPLDLSLSIPKKRKSDKVRPNKEEEKSKKESKRCKVSGDEICKKKSKK